MNAPRSKSVFDLPAPERAKLICGCVACGGDRHIDCTVATVLPMVLIADAETLHIRQMVELSRHQEQLSYTAGPHATEAIIVGSLALVALAWAMGLL